MTDVHIRRETLRDLARTEGPAELIGGRVVRMAAGDLPSQVGGRIFRSLADYADRRGGQAYTDGAGFTVPEMPSGRESFCPDAAYHVGPFPRNRMKFLNSAPTFAVEVRSENDYGDAADARIEAKRADYFAAGTLVVWDVDPVAERVSVYRASDPSQATSYGRGQTAEAEPAVPGWSVSVDWIFG